MVVLNRTFVLIAGILLAITGAAKIISAFGTQMALIQTDPLAHISFRHLLVLVGIVEIIIACFCLFTDETTFNNLLIAWFSTILCVYRIGLHVMGWKQPCHCLGSLADALHISSRTADIAMKIVLAYLIIGGYGILLRQWWIRKAEGRTQNDGRKPAAIGSENRADS